MNVCVCVLLNGNNYLKSDLWFIYTLGANLFLCVVLEVKHLAYMLRFVNTQAEYTSVSAIIDSEGAFA